MLRNRAGIHYSIYLIIAGAMQRMIISWNRVNNVGAIPSVTSAPSSFSLKGMKIQLVSMPMFDWVPVLSRLHWTQCTMELQRKLLVALGFLINGPTPGEKPTFEPAE